MPINSEDSEPLDVANFREAKPSNRLPVPDKGPAAESWVTLCAQAAVEQDPRRLLELVKQINFLLDARRQRLLREPDKTFTPQQQPRDGKISRRDHEPE